SALPGHGEERAGSDPFAGVCHRPVSEHLRPVLGEAHHRLEPVSRARAWLTAGHSQKGFPAMCSSKVQGRSIIGFCSFLLLSGCGGIAESDEFIEVHEEEQVGISWEEYRDQAETSVNGKVAYVVEGDLFFDSEADLYEYYEDTILNDGWKLAVFQRLSNGFEPVYTRTEALDIKYCVSNLFQSSYAPFDKNRVVTDAQAAMRDWEKVANVRFRYVSAQDSSCTETNANVDFAIIPMTTTSFAGCAMNKKMWNGPNM